MKGIIGYSLVYTLLCFTLTLLALVCALSLSNLSSSSNLLSSLSDSLTRHELQIHPDNENIPSPPFSFSLSLLDDDARHAYLSKISDR